MNEDVLTFMTMIREDLAEFRAEVRATIQNTATKDALTALADRLHERVALLEEKLAEERRARITEQDARKQAQRRMWGTIIAGLTTAAAISTMVATWVATIHH